MRYAKKRDTSEAAIISALEQMGCTVQRINEANAPDLLVGRLGVTHLLEVKAEAGKEGGTSNRNLSPGQQAWHGWWRGGRVHLVRTVDEALRAVMGAK